MRDRPASRPATLAAAVALVAALACSIDDSDPQPAMDRPAPRRFTTFRQRHGEHELDTRLWLTQGSLRLAPSRAGELYRIDMTYDSRETTPVATFRPGDAALRVHMASGALDTAGGGSDTSMTFAMKLGGDEKPVHRRTALAISPDVDATLNLTLVDVEADLDLGGHRLSSLDLMSNAGRTTVRFSQPNRVACDKLAVTSNVDDTSLLGLGNSRCGRVSVHSTVAGKTVLDFGGDWSSDMTVDAAATVGALTLRLPRDVGVRMTARTVFASLESDDLVRDGDTFVSRNYADAAHRLDIDLRATLGSISVEWIGD